MSSANDSLRISEIFFSLQGETGRVGLPTVFVRLTGCPLRCNYCDTTYAFTGGKTRAAEKANWTASADASPNRTRLRTGRSMTRAQG